MSLINEALKKAQAQRDSSTPAGPPPPAGHQPMPSSSGGSTGWLVAGLIASIVLVFSVGAALITWGLLRTANPEPARSTATTTTTAAAHTPATAPVPPTENSAEEDLAPIEFRIAEPPPASSPESPAEASTAAPETGSGATVQGQATDNPSPPEPISSSAPPMAATAPSPAGLSLLAEPVPVTRRASADPAVQDYLATLEVRGVMSGGQKALLYNRTTQRSQAYGVGATISNRLQIKIQDITERNISFIDHDGYVYTKSF